MSVPMLNMPELRGYLREVLPASKGEYAFGTRTYLVSVLIRKLSPEQKSALDVRAQHFALKPRKKQTRKKQLGLPRCRHEKKQTKGA